MSVVWWNDDHKARAYKSFTTFLYEQPRIYRNNNFVCLTCDGAKKVIADYERPDPVEGYKMADRVPCLKCNGTGLATEKQWREYFKIHQAEFRARKTEEKRISKLKKQAIKKLTLEERKALGV